MTVAWGGGGSLELLATDRRGIVRIYRNFGGQRPPVLMEPRTLQCGHAPLELPDDRTVVVAADLDGDRRAELVYGTSSGHVFSVHSGPTRNDAKTPEELLSERSELWLAGHAVVTVGDLDADGDLDLVFGDASGRLHYLQDMGTRDDHRYLAPVAIEGGGTPFRVDPGPDGMLDGPLAPRLGYSCPTLADWTGNGRLDLLVSGAGGEILFLRNDGAADSPRFGSPSPLRCDGGPLIIPPRVRPAVADWNASGQADLIALDLQGLLCVFPRTGNARCRGTCSPRRPTRSLSATRRRIRSGRSLQPLGGSLDRIGADGSPGWSSAGEPPRDPGVDRPPLGGPGELANGHPPRKRGAWPSGAPSAPVSRRPPRDHRRRRL